MVDTVRLAVVAPETVLRQRVEEIARTTSTPRIAVVAVGSTLAELLRADPDREPSLVLVTESAPDCQREQIMAVRRRYPRTALVLIGRRSMDGVDRVIPEMPSDPATFQALLREIGPTSHPDTALSDSPTAGNHQGIIVSWAIDHGVGRATVVSNLAMALALDGKKSVVYVNARRPFSDFRYTLKIAEHLYSRSLYGVAQETSLDARGLPQVALAVIERNLLTYATDPNATHGCKILLGAPTEQQARHPMLNNEHFLPALLHTLERYYEYVFVDVTANLWTDPAQVPVLKLARRLLITMIPHEPHLQLYEARLGAVLSSGDIDPGNVDIVLNRVRADVPIRAETIKRRLGIDVLAELPDAPADVELAISNRAPIILTHDPESTFIHAFRNLVNRYAEVYPYGEPPRPSVLQRLPFFRRNG